MCSKKKQMSFSDLPFEAGKEEGRKKGGIFLCLCHKEYNVAV
jgi:hypothetical protein